MSWSKILIQNIDINFKFSAGSCYWQSVSIFLFIYFLINRARTLNQSRNMEIMTLKP